MAVPPPEILEDVEDGGQYWNVLPVLLLSLGNHLELSIKGTHLFCHAQRGIRYRWFISSSVQVLQSCLHKSS